MAMELGYAQVAARPAACTAGRRLARFSRLETAWKNDLPEGFDPMTAKELRQSLRRGSFVYPFLGIQLLAVVAMAAEFKLGHAGESEKYAGALNFMLLGKSGPFWMVVAAVCLLIM